MCVICDPMCVFVACHDGTPQAVRVSSGSLSKKQAAPSGLPTPFSVFSGDLVCMNVCFETCTCTVFTTTHARVNTRTQTQMSVQSQGYAKCSSTY